LDAYGYYLIGRHHWERRGETDLRRSIEMYERALSLDPNFALAFAGLADTYTVMATNKVAPALEMAAKARDAAHKAIALDSHIAEPHAALGTILPCFDWDWESAEKEFRRALELNPGYATGRQWYGLHLLTRGRFHDAERQLRLARDLNPLAWMIAVNVGDVLYYSGQYDRAVAEYRKVIETDGGYLVPDLMTAAALFRLGRFNEVIPHADIFLSKNPWHPYAAGYKILALRKTGDIRQYELLRAGFEQARTEKYYAPDLRAWIYAMFGENEQALAELQKAYEAHEAPSTKIKIDPAFDALRSDPRFQALLKAARLDR
jgi:tetratricopeptide (TPR) repeat protein